MCMYIAQSLNRPLNDLLGARVQDLLTLYSLHTEPHSRGSGTDAMATHISREGVPTGIISIPLRYMHTMVESIAIKDVERSGRLMGEFIAQLDDDFLANLAAGLMD